MTPELIALIAQYAIKFGIPAGQALVKMFQTQRPTQADWDALWAITTKSYDDYIRGPQNPPAP